MLLHIICADSALSRFDASLLCDQTLMELLIGTLPESNQQEFKDSNGDFLNVCLWKGVQCDSDENVLKINFSESDLSGSISLDHLPPHTTSIRFRWKIAPTPAETMHGTLNAASLPLGMETVNLTRNTFFGSIDFQDLPQSMINVYLTRNEFVGTVAFASLPSALEDMRIDINNFTGPVVLTALPPKLRLCDLSSNAFVGTIDVTRLPRGMKYLNVKNNELEGTVVIENIPEKLLEINLRKNYFVPMAKGKKKSWLKVGQYKTKRY